MTDWNTPPPGFRSVLLGRTQRSENVQRFYRMSWLPTLFGEGAVVRMVGRKGRSLRTLITPFDSLEAAWPFIRRTIKTRLRHGYQVVVIDAGSEV